jgi:peptidoglycan/LPS O-acetylase OafA/YrhL
MDRPAMQIRPLTALRFFAALGVFFHHAIPVWAGTPLAPPEIMHTILYEGCAGVSFFFLLSGFILAHNYADRFHSPSWCVAREFYIARFARIFPLHLLTLAASLPLVLPMISQHPAQAVRYAIANLTLTQAFVPSQGCYLCFNGVSWSLSVEAFLYVCFPVLAFALCQFGRRRLPVWIAAAILICGLMVATSWAGMHAPRPKWATSIFPVPRLLDFSLGILLNRIWKELQARRIAACSKAVGTAIELSTVGLLFVFVCFSPHVPADMHLAGYYPLPMSLVLLAFALGRGALSQWLSRPAFCYLGEISFAFYMTHMLVFAHLAPFRLLAEPSFASAVVGTLYWLSATIVVSAVCHAGYERPTRKWIVERLKLSTSTKYAQFAPSAATSPGTII